MNADRPGLAEQLHTRWQFALHSACRITHANRFHINISHYSIKSYDESTAEKVETYESPCIKGNDKEMKVQNNNSHTAG